MTRVVEGGRLGADAVAGNWRSGGWVSSAVEGNSLSAEDVNRLKCAGVPEGLLLVFGVVGAEGSVGVG